MVAKEATPLVLTHVISIMHFSAFALFVCLSVCLELMTVEACTSTDVALNPS